VRLRLSIIATAEQPANIGSSTLPNPLDLAGRLLRARRAEPVTHGLLLDAHALPVEPLILALVVVARHHVAEADALAEAVLGVVRFLLVCISSADARHVFVLGAGLARYALIVGRG
jgi:hypothetical protein